jgi:hypothetical protein
MVIVIPELMEVVLVH